MSHIVSGKIFGAVIAASLLVGSSFAAIAQTDEGTDESQVNRRNFAASANETPEPSSDRTVELGELKCVVRADQRRNYIIRSTAPVDCAFTSIQGEKENYRGVTGIQLGVDLSVREKDTLRFLVVSSHKMSEGRPAHALEGKYFGAAATASVTYGVGAAALVGGKMKHISLQPVGVETLRGLGVSAGLGYLYLEAAPDA